MKKLLTALFSLAAGAAVLAQPVIPTTPFTRNMLRSNDAAGVRAHIGVTTTNAGIAYDAANLSAATANVKGLYSNTVSGTHKFYALEAGTGLGLSATATSVVATAYATNANTLFVRKDGNNTTAVKGDANKPFSSVSNAIAAASSGDTIFIYPGEYVELLHTNGAPLQVLNKTNLSIIGIGQPVIYATNSWYGQLMWVSDSVGVTIDGIVFRGAPTNAADGGEILSSAIEFRLTNMNARIQNCDFIDFPGHGVTHLDALRGVDENVFITGNYFTNIGRTNLLIGAGTPSTNHIDGAAVSGIGSGWIIQGNIVDECARGLEIERPTGKSARGVFISENVFRGVRGANVLNIYGADGDHQSQIVFSGNVIYGYRTNAWRADNYGVELLNCNNVIISGNTIENTLNTGLIWAANTNNTMGVIANNVIRDIGNYDGTDSSGAGINVYSVSGSPTTLKAVVIEGNILDRINSSGIEAWGEGMLINGNFLSNTRTNGSGAAIWIRNSGGSTPKATNVVICNNLIYDYLTTSPEKTETAIQIDANAYGTRVFNNVIGPSYTAALSDSGTGTQIGIATNDILAWPADANPVSSTDYLFGWNASSNRPVRVLISDIAVAQGDWITVNNGVLFDTGTNALLTTATMGELILLKTNLASLDSLNFGLDGYLGGGFKVTRKADAIAGIENLAGTDYADLMVKTTTNSGNAVVAGTNIMGKFRLTNGPVNGYVLTSDGDGIGTWKAAVAGTPAGTADGQIQYKSGAAFAGAPFVTTDGSNFHALAAWVTNNFNVLGTNIITGGLQFTNSDGVTAGQVLKADASGFATWQDEGGAGLTNYLGSHISGASNISIACVGVVGVSNMVRTLSSGLSVLFTEETSNIVIAVPAAGDLMSVQIHAADNSIGSLSNLTWDPTRRFINVTNADGGGHSNRIRIQGATQTSYFDDNGIGTELGYPFALVSSGSNRWNIAAVGDLDPEITDVLNIGSGTKRVGTLTSSNIVTEFIKITDSAAADAVLVSDADGIATWQAKDTTFESFTITNALNLGSGPHAYLLAESIGLLSLLESNNTALGAIRFGTNGDGVLISNVANTILRLRNNDDSADADLIVGDTTNTGNSVVIGTNILLGYFKMTTTPTNGFVLTSDADGVGTWKQAPAGNPGGSVNGEVQFKSGAAFDAEAGFSWDTSTKLLTVSNVSVLVDTTVSNLAVNGTFTLSNATPAAAAWDLYGTNGKRVRLTVTNDMAADTMIVLPPANGTAGQVLTLIDTTNTSWATPAGGDMSITNAYLPTNRINFLVGTEEENDLLLYDAEHNAFTNYNPNLVPFKTVADTASVTPIDMATNAMIQEITVDSGDITLITTNRASYSKVRQTATCYLLASGAARTITFDTNWKVAGTNTTSAVVPQNAYMILNLKGAGTAETDIIATYTVTE